VAFVSGPGHRGNHSALLFAGGKNSAKNTRCRRMFSDSPAVCITVTNIVGSATLKKILYNIPEGWILMCWREFFEDYPHARQRAVFIYSIALPPGR